MSILGASEYHVFASWSGVAASNLGTTTELRAGVWYEGRIVTPPEPGMRFGDALGLQRATDVTLGIAESPGGPIRTACAAGALEGIVVTLTTVMRSTSPTGSVSEAVRQYRLTCVGASASPTEVRMRLVDLEAKKLGALYPERLWLADDWPDISEREAGRAVCYPVGTALKLPCPQVRRDPLNPVPEWHFGVCEGTPTVYPISAVTVSWLTMPTNLVGVLRPGQVIYVVGSTSSDGRYTISQVQPTRIVVAETLVASATPGAVYVMPDPLSVYRSGRIVPAAEYTAHWLHNIGAVTNGDFAAGLAGWTQWYYTTGGGYTNTNPGAGSSLTTGAGGLTIVSVSATNFAWAQQYGGTMSARKGALYAVQVTVAPGFSDAVVTADGPPVMAHRCPAGKTTTVLLSAGFVGAFTSFGIGVWNNNGTVTITRVRTLPIDAVLLRFASEQLDYQGNPYAIEADVFSYSSRNVSTEIERLLNHVGVTVNAGSFSAGAVVAAAESMWVDCDHGRAGQRRVSSILEDLLFVARGGMSRSVSGYEMWQDVATPVAAIYDESLGDPIEVTGYERDGRPGSVAIKYRPSSRDPRELTLTKERTIAGGLLGDENPRNLPCVRDNAAADRLISYLAARRKANAQATAVVYRANHTVGERIIITSPLYWSGAKDWLVRAVRAMPNRSELELIEYDASVYTYTPGFSTADPVDDYKPDYSRTPPAAPTAMLVTGGGSRLAVDGATSVSVAVQCTAPAVNWVSIWFAVIHDVTGEIIQQQATLSGSAASANFAGLRAGEVYQLKAWAINAFGLSGALLSAFNATAIGGGALVSTFTAPGYATLPPDVPSIAVDRGTGAVLVVTWSAVTLPGDNLADYVLERRAGFGAWLEVWRGRALNFVDRDVSYGTGYTYRVKARNRWGSMSANWRLGTMYVLNRNISGGGAGDIMDNTVQTVNRTVVTTFFAQVPMSGAFRAVASYAHGIGKVPIACVTGSDYDVIGSIHSIDATDLVVRATHFADGLTEAAFGPGSHTHALKRSPSPGFNYTVVVTFW